MPGTNPSQDHNAERPESRPPEASGGATGSGGGDNVDALHRVIAESLSDACNRPVLESAEMKPLLDVARRHNGCSFAFDPVVADLVEAAVVGFFAPSGGDAAAPWRAVSRRVAKSLFADAYANKRLERLWKRLSEAVSS